MGAGIVIVAGDKFGIGTCPVLATITLCALVPVITGGVVRREDAARLVIAGVVVTDGIVVGVGGVVPVGVVVGVGGVATNEYNGVNDSSPTPPPFPVYAQDKAFSGASWNPPRTN